MIKKLQKKFIIITMSSLFLVIILIVGTINMLNYQQTNKRIDDILDVLVEHDGEFPENRERKEALPEPKNRGLFDTSKELPFSTRYFSLQINALGQIEEINTSRVAALTSEEAKVYGVKAEHEKKETGYIAGYKYKKIIQNGTTLIVFIDVTIQINSMTTLFLLSIGIAGIAFTIVFVLVTLLSRRAIRPVIESMQKQKQFITDASHEIKTPLAVIAANAEVLDLQKGENEWTRSIKNQVGRLDTLVRSMSTLAKMQESGSQIDENFFPVDQVLGEAIHEFEALAQIHHMTIKKDIVEGITYCGSESQMRQVFSILLDNAMKYGQQGTQIEVQLYSITKWISKGIYISFYNKTKDPLEGNLQRLFNRFHREDKGRTSDGYGLGLSIAQSMVESQKGKINARLQEEGIIFQIYLPEKVHQ